MIESDKKMDKKVKQKWVKTLRSGKYKQVRGQLKKQCRSSEGGVGYCCLGVLCDLYSKESGVTWTHTEYSPLNFNDTFLGHDIVLPHDVSEWAQLSDDNEIMLARKNDNGASFKQIADFIQENL